MSKLRFRVVETAFKKKAATVETPAERPSEYFAKYVFNREKMFKYLPGAVYAKLTDAMDNGAPLDLVHSAVTVPLFSVQIIVKRILNKQ